MALALAPLGTSNPGWAKEAGAPVDPAAGLLLPAERYRAVIGRPPTTGSKEEEADLAILRWNERTRTSTGVLHSWRFLSLSLSSFDAAIGADLLKTAPTLSAGLPTFLKRIDQVKDQLKDSLARPRPYVSHGEFRPCLPPENSFSFPSGHATWYAAAGLLLADLLPQRRERLLDTALQGGYSRTYCGVHYPSDVLASQRLAAALTRDVLTSPQWQLFRRQMEAELGQLLVLPPAGLPALSN
ncbi:phosphatase PAP2 family protein [Synechococcus sp. Tobar12-5m-g]|jgi:acid phosphatase (class A)|nr:phosphatase PAP2 family protein [Synechococcus sp. Tobar12-5m-g]MCP9874193.1 phosphatase PAP2 family protein [Synechococcus sp. Cruz CV-v-12]